LVSILRLLYTAAAVLDISEMFEMIMTNE